MIQPRLKSFTLIEILVVIIIVGILASLVLFSTNDAFDKQKRMEVLNLTEGLKGKNVDLLVSEWNFDGPTSAEAAATNNDVKDSWGYNHGDITGHAPTVKTGEDCVSGKCLYFDGVDDYIQLGEATSKFTGVTVSLWINPSDTGSRNLFNSNPLILHYRGAGFYLRIDGGGTCGYLGWSPAPSANKWSYVVATWNNPLIGDGQMRLYIDGVKQGTELACAGGTYGRVNSGTLTIGHYFNTSQVWYKGLIDEVRVYNKGLSISEVKQNYVAGLDSMLKNGAILKEDYNKRMLNLAKND